MAVKENDDDATIEKDELSGKAKLLKSFKEYKEFIAILVFFSVAPYGYMRLLQLKPM